MLKAVGTSKFEYNYNLGLRTVEYRPGK